MNLMSDNNVYKVEITGIIQPSGKISVLLSEEQYFSVQECLNKLYKERVYMREYQAKKRGQNSNNKHHNRKQCIIFTEPIKKLLKQEPKAIIIFHKVKFSTYNNVFQHIL